MIFSALLRFWERRNKEQTPPVLPHRGGGRLAKPIAAGEPQQWQPPIPGTTPADRKRRRKRIRRRRARITVAAHK